jgi:membrane-associated phospholipid phosphatase
VNEGSGVGRSGPGRVVYPIEVLSLPLNLLFGVCCLLNIGKARAAVLGVAMDRELLMGLCFLLLTPLTLLLVRLLNPARGSLARFLRLCYPQALYVLYFTESIWLSQLIFGGASLDGFFAGLDRLLFGFQPSVEFSRHLHDYPLVNELFFFSYFFYYALVATGVWVLFARRRVHRAERVLFVISASFFIMYVWFVFFPVKGPKYYFADLRAAWYSDFSGYFFTRFMKAVFNHTNLGGAAFPSSHVAIAVVSLLLNWKHNRFLIPVYLPLTLLLFASTVYLYAHYFVDVAAGIPVGIALYFLVHRLEPLVARAAERVDAVLSRRLGFPPMAVAEGEDRGEEPALKFRSRR